MTTARDVMNRGAQCIGADQTLLDAARTMRDLGIGSLPIQGADGALTGMLTDRDIVVGCVADGADPSSTPASALASGTVRTVEADDDVDQILSVMREHQVKRLPVLEGGQLVGMISESDLPAQLDAAQISHFVEGVYSKR